MARFLLKVNFQHFVSGHNPMPQHFLPFFLHQNSVAFILEHLPNSRKVYLVRKGEEVDILGLQSAVLQRKLLLNDEFIEVLGIDDRVDLALGSDHNHFVSFEVELQGVSHRKGTLDVHLASLLDPLEVL